MRKSILVLYVSKVRRVDGHRREIFPGSIVRPVLVGIKICDLMVASSRGSTRSTTGRNIYDESFFDGLTTRVISIEGLSDGLFGTQGALSVYIFVVWFTTDDLEGDIRSVNTAPEGISIFSKNDISDIVDEVVFGYFDSRGRGARSFHPYLSLHSWKTFMTVGVGLGKDRYGGIGWTLNDKEGRWRWWCWCWCWYRRDGVGGGRMLRADFWTGSSRLANDWVDGRNIGVGAGGGGGS